MGISPYYLALMNPAHPLCPVRMQSIPVRAEARVRPGERVDPLGEDPHRPVEAIVHKYPDRVLFLAHGHLLGLLPALHPATNHQGWRSRADPQPQFEPGIDYIGAPRGADVLISGGDPLLLSDERLEAAAGPAARHPPRGDDPHRHPRAGALPMRVTPALATFLRRLAPVYVVTHFNHAKEITPEARRACELLVDHGVPVENQSVLMRRLNSEARIIRELTHACLRMRVRPVLPAPDGRGGGVRAPAHPIRVAGHHPAAARLHLGDGGPALAVDLPGGAAR